jgi:hypothetical protein
MGWLVLAGIPPALGQAGAQISERLLEVADLSRPPLLLSPDSSLPEEIQTFLEDIQTLLGVELHAVNPAELEDEDLRDLWLTAGIMIMAGGTQLFWQELVDGRLFRIRPQEILAEGSVLFAFGPSASLMGAWMLDDELHVLEQGLGWILGSIVLPINEDPAEIAAVHNHLEEKVGAIALALPDGAMLALGPDNQIEVWTEKAPVLLLGKGWQQ